MRHVTPIPLKWESCQVIQKCKCQKKNKQTNKQTNERVEVIMYGLSPYGLFDNLTL